MSATPIPEAPRPAGWADRLAQRAGRLQSAIVRRILVVGVLSMMVMLGLFLSNYSSQKSHDYWFAMFPIFGFGCFLHELASGRAYEVALWRIVVRHILHWLGPIIAVEILFLQYARGQMSTDAVALTVILMLAITSFLAGVHFDSSFYWIAAVLVFAALIGTEIETYLWLVVVLLIVAAAIAIISAMLLHRGRTTPKPGAT